MSKAKERIQAYKKEFTKKLATIPVREKVQKPNPVIVLLQAIQDKIFLLLNKDYSVTVNIPEQKKAEITVNVPEQVKPSVIVNVPEQKQQLAPIVNVRVPEQPKQPAPIIHVKAPDIIFPEQQMANAWSFAIIRDDRGLITNIRAERKE